LQQNSVKATQKQILWFIDTVNLFPPTRMDCVREPAIVTSDSDVTRQDLRGKFAEKLVGDWIPVFA
jgi:hypothetical protein